MKPEDQEDIRAWVQARVDEAGSVDDACPDRFTRKAWRDLCRHLGIGKRAEVRTLKEALRAVADLAHP